MKIMFRIDSFVLWYTALRRIGLSRSLQVNPASYLCVIDAHKPVTIHLTYSEP